MLRLFTRRFVATLSLAVFLLPALQLSLAAAHDDEMAMACCIADTCQTPVLGAPCCTHDTASHATPQVPGTSPTARDLTPVAPWALVAHDLPTLAMPARARALADVIRGRPPDPPHLLHSVFLI